MTSAPRRFGPLGFNVRCWLWLSGLLALPLSAQTVPSGGTSLIDVADYATQASFYGGTGSGGGVVASRTIIDVSGQPFSQAARIEVQNPTGEFWSSAAQAFNNRALAAGDVVLIHFFMRAERSTDETGTVFMQVFAEGPGPDFEKSLSRQVNAGPEWIEFFLPFTVEDNYAVGDFGIKVGFGAGDRPRTIDFGGFEVLWYGKSRTLEEMPRTAFSYEGRAADAPWRAEAAARIEQYRKANYGIRVLDADGQPVPGATVRFRLRRHAFPFGTAIQSRLIVNPNGADEEMYRTKLVELFNAAGPENDLKWAPWIGEWGNAYNQSQTLAALEWLAARDFHLRGHVLVWPSDRNLPDVLNPISQSQTPQRVLDHIGDIVPKTRDLLTEWDVLNEPYDNNELMTLFGQDIMVDWFQEAREHHSTAKLFINEYGILSGGGVNGVKQQFYEDTIRYLLEQGAPLDGIGLQGHFDTSPTAIPRLYTVLERYATAFPGLDIKITEFDVDTEDEELQGDYTRDFLTMVFSHPAVTGFQMWGFWENAHWRARAAMYRSNWEEKPNGKAFRELVHGAWKTDETQVADADGRVAGRGFLGDYDVIVTSPEGNASQKVTLPASGLDRTVTLSSGNNQARMINVATRGVVGTGENIMIVGFVVRGGEKDVVVRGVGPRLADYGVPGVLPDPHLVVRELPGGVERGNNQDWSDPDVRQPGGLDLGDDDKSAAVKLTMSDGTYTAEVAGEGDGTGVALAEVYDVALDAPARLINLSTRGSVGTGDNVLIGSFVIRGEGTLKVLIRAIGPGLTPYGVSGVLLDPQVTVQKLNTDLQYSNDDWGAADSALIAETAAAVGAFPLESTSSKDAALLLELDEGSYTATVSGVGATTGIALIEAYAVE